jgi:predicted TIM-barrel fold metal-dependent hydrolase
MDFAQLADVPVVDAHIHFPHSELLGGLLEVMDAARLARANLVAVPDLQVVNQNPALIWAKAQAPERFYICGALDYTQFWADPASGPRALARQVATLRSIGFDGLKLIEGKPMVRKLLSIPFDGPEYAELWAAVEETGLPVICHLADPEEFWDAAACPDWAHAQGWFYGDGSYPEKEAFYAEIDAVLARRPGLRIVFAHFCFLAADLARAAAFLDAHPAVFFDLTPGVEMYYHFARDPQAARDFFLRYQDRLIFGSDIGASSLGIDPAKDLDRAESLGRAWVVRRFLESEDAFFAPEGVGHWLGMDTGVFRGIGLTKELLRKIYQTNVERLLGAEPAALNMDAAQAELRRQASVVDALAGGRAEQNPAQRVAGALEGGPPDRVIASRGAL